jgi:hypothetical protein
MSSIVTNHERDGYDMKWNGLLEGNVLSGTDFVFTEMCFYGEILHGTFHIPNNYYL